MEINTDHMIENALRDAVREGIKAKFTSAYGDNPLGKMLTAGVEKHVGAIQGLIGECLAACVSDAEFRAQLAASVRSVLAKTLVQRFGGELERQVNALKSDPVTRARITLAIEDIVKARTTTT